MPTLLKLVSIIIKWSKKKLQESFKSKEIYIEIYVKKSR